MKRYLNNSCYSNRTRALLRRALGLSLVLVALVGLAYPFLGAYVDEQYQSIVCASYEAEAKTKAEKTQKNKASAGQEDAVYVSSDGLTGFIEIPSIDLQVGIYEGTEEDKLEKGIGHVTSSGSLSGGKHNLCILCGHSGMRSKKMFTDLSELKKGDYIFLHVGDEIHYYKVKRQVVLLPEEAEAKLDREKTTGKGDRIALVTCTPYGVNTHRLIVYGKRITKPSVIKKLSMSDSHAAKRNSTWMAMYVKGLKAGGIAVVCVCLAVMVIRLIRRRFRLFKKVDIC